MHELSITESILEIALRHGEENNAKIITIFIWLLEIFLQ
jgi:Zn finger protein HypA/HybF involved in hydrogenase expression